MTTLQEYRENIKDIARSNRFLLSIEGDTAEQLDLPRNFQFLVSKASIPKKDISGPTIKYRGTNLMLTGDYKKEPLVVTLWNDIDWNVRSYFENWINQLLSTTEDNVRGDVAETRFGNDVILKPLGPNLNELSRYRFKEAIPMEIGDIELDLANENTLQDFTVAFHYSHFIRD